MQLDFLEMRQKAKEAEEQREKALRVFLNSLKDREKKERDYIARLLRKAGNTK